MRRKMFKRDIMEEDARTEAAMAAAACTKANIVPENSKITPSQLSKFQELRKRRLQIKEKSKPKKKIMGNGKSHNEKKEINLEVKSAANQEGSILTSSKGADTVENSSSKGSTSTPAHPVSTPKRKKLHWGLDTKERWEMKANM